MDEPIESELFPELVKLYDVKLGVYPEFTSITHAKQSFRRAMRNHGYRQIAPRTWSKPGMAVVIEPDHLKGPRARGLY